MEVTLNHGFTWGLEPTTLDSTLIQIARKSQTLLKALMASNLECCQEAKGCQKLISRPVAILEFPPSARKQDK